MARMNSKNFQELLKVLSNDPAIKEAIKKAKAKTSGEMAFEAASIVDLLMHLLKMSGLFIGGKKVKLFTEMLDAVVFIITVSLIVKKNVFDKPEVRDFFEDQWVGAKRVFGSFYDFCKEHVSTILARVHKKRQGRVRSAV